MKNEPSKLLRACELVLLYHDGGPWTFEKANAWANGLTDIMGPALFRRDLPSNEATTKNLCNAVRAAVADFTGNLATENK